MPAWPSLNPLGLRISDLGFGEDGELGFKGIMLYGVNDYGLAESGFRTQGFQV